MRVLFLKDVPGVALGGDVKEVKNGYARNYLIPYNIAVLANDEVKDGYSERGNFAVEQKKMRQWSLRITAYADRLLQGLQDLDWSKSIKEIQKNWIGKSNGALINFSTIDNNIIEVFTTRPDTIYGVSFLVVAPELNIIDLITHGLIRYPFEFPYGFPFE